MTAAPNDPLIDRPPQPSEAADQNGVGYKKPPKHSQFQKGQSGNPGGRPKALGGISIKDLLDGEQLGKNGEIISRREAIVIRMLNDALNGNQKAFGRFLKLLTQSGLRRAEQPSQVKNVFYESRPMTSEEYEEFKRNFGRPAGEPRK